MNPDDFADTFSLALQVDDAARPRSVQTEGGILGGSDAMGCSAKAVYTIRGETPTQVPKKGKAQAGTFLHAGTLNALGALFPQLVIEASLTVTLPSGLEVPLHPDLIDPDEPSVCDLKFVSDLALTRRVGVTDQQQAQRHLQYLAAHQAGLVPAEGTVRNLFVSANDMDERWVHQEPFSMDWIRRADDWYQSVIYAAQTGEDGQREKPIYFCQDFCPFFQTCRPPLADSEARITNAELVQVAQIAYESRELRKSVEVIEKQAVERLKGVTGRAGDVRVVTTTVNKASGSYMKVDLRVAS